MSTTPMRKLDSQVTRELQIRTTDGETRTVPLDRDRFSLGRSSANELCYADDGGLSRQHVAFEKDGEIWIVRDLGSKNGTLVNGERISQPHLLKVGDRIGAGHLVIDFAEPGIEISHTVMFIEGSEGGTPTATTVITSLQGLLGDNGENASPDPGSLDGGRQMRALIRAGRELAGHRPLADLFRLIMDLSIDAVGGARGVLMTLERGELVVREARGDGFRISTTVRDRVLNERASLLVRDAQLDQSFKEQMSIVEQKVRSMLAVPLQTNDRVIGLIYLDSPHLIREFTKEDLNLLTVLANVAAIRIEHARLNEVEQAEQLLARDLEQAADIQRRLLPSSAPIVAGVDLAGYNAACRTVGGDYYDFLTYSDGRVAMLVGDVAGKGMSAALMMSSLHARVQMLFDDPSDLAAMVTRLNRNITPHCPAGRFITFFICVYDPLTAELTYVNAGHNPPLLVRCNGTVDRLEGDDPILGIFPNAVFGQRVCRLGVGDVVVLYSDGVTEATPPDVDEEFGEERLAAVLKERSCEPAKVMVSAVIEEVVKFTKGAPPADDITLVVARRTA